jgi:hypothetical protein
MSITLGILILSLLVILALILFSFKNKEILSTPDNLKPISDFKSDMEKMLLFKNQQP